MKTLIELYDERPIENILSADLFRPEKVVYLCPSSVAGDRKMRSSIEKFFSHRGVETKVATRGTSMHNTEEMIRALRAIVAENPDCALDITGGSDAALFAAGRFSAESEIPVFTYSRRKNRYFNIYGAALPENLPVKPNFSAEDFFRMAGAEIGTGRSSDTALAEHLNQIDAFFNIYMRYRRQWKKAVIWFQKSAPVPADPNDLRVHAGYTVKGEFRGTVSANEALLKELEKLGFIHDLDIERGKSVDFRFDDQATRFWLRDTGSVLELYTWKACVDAGIFNDVRCSMIIHWDDSVSPDRDRSSAVTNEIDVFAARNIVPIFISCKVCAIDTDALNELAILKDRFGGEMARACIVSTEDTRAVTRSRAASLGIDVIALSEIKNGNLAEQLRVMYC